MLPITVLDEEARKMDYGIPAEHVPPQFKSEMDGFTTWSSMPVNLSRGMQYAHGVQATTVEGHLKQMRAYAGYLTLYGNVTLEEVSLQHYADPTLFLSFISFLRARNVTRYPLVHHVSLARKVNAYLSTGPDACMIDSRDMDDWLKLLEAQLHTAVPTKPKADLPLAEQVLPWVVGLGEKALRAVHVEVRGLTPTELQSFMMTKKTAVLVQKAIVASFVTGCHTPPIRLNLITTVQHPEFVDAGLTCKDPDCRAKDSCLGNRFALLPYVEPAGGACVLLCVCVFCMPAWSARLCASFHTWNTVAITVILPPRCS